MVNPAVAAKPDFKKFLLGIGCFFIIFILKWGGGSSNKNSNIFMNTSREPVASGYANKMSPSE